VEVFTFTFKPARDSTEPKKIQFESCSFFGAVDHFYRHVSKHHPDFELLQIKDQYGNQFYNGTLQPEGCVRSGGVS